MTVTWNGTNITGPVLIYQDELIDDRSSPTASPNNGILICTSQDHHRVGWHLPGADSISEAATGDFKQTRTGSGVTPSVSRLSVNKKDVSRDDAITNGLWTCRLNGNFRAPVPIPVGIYDRGRGEWLEACDPHQL